MLNKINKDIKFMTLSIITLFIFATLLIIAVPLVFSKNKSDIADTIYLNDNYTSADPLLTQIPNLEDIINGPIITATDPILGPANAPVAITIYTNFSCKYCAQVLQIAQQAQADMPGKVRIVHKDFPSKNKSYASYQAAIAGRCAQEQNAFWEMSNLLYQSHDNLNQDNFLKFARELKLNLKQFQKCLDGKTNAPTTQLIDDDIAEANALQIIGIPLLYINDYEIMGEITVEELRSVVEQKLNLN